MNPAIILINDLCKVLNDNALHVPHFIQHQIKIGTPSNYKNIVESLLTILDKNNLMYEYDKKSTSKVIRPVIVRAHQYLLHEALQKEISND